MKTLNFLLFILLSSTCFCNEIDKLQTNQDVCDFLVKKVNKDFKKRPPLDISINHIDTAKFSRNIFFKIDIDNNALTDLIIYGYRDFLVVVDNGKNNYLVRYVNNGIFSLNTATLVSIDTVEQLKKIIIKQREKPESQVDTLIFKFDNFIEYNSNPVNDFVFEKITFKTSRCFGTCPIFEMTIDKYKTATYNAIQYNNETGYYKGTITTKEFDELISLLKYLQLDELQNEYAVNWTDDQTATIEISYNGKSKIIKDYGKIGTFGLSNLYSKFFYWRKIIEWAG